jgi:hypothetical protein
MYNEYNTLMSRSFIGILFLFILQLGYGQEGRISFADQLIQQEFSYPLLHQGQQDHFAFNFSAQPMCSTYLTVKPVPTVNHLPGMFCKLEYQIEKKSKLAPRFRLGSLAYTEWREGKQGFYDRYYK